MKFNPNASHEAGWYAHYVMDDKLYPFGVNYHTHGIWEKYGHQDFQICFPLPPPVAHKIIWSLVEELETGSHFRTGKLYYDFIERYPVQFIQA